MPAALALNAPLVRCGAATERVRRTAAAHVAPRGLGIATPSRSRAVAPVAALPKKEKSITRDDEPEEYWSSKAERGGNPMKDPLAIIGVVSIFLPFVLLLIAAALGIVDLSPRA